MCSHRWLPLGYYVPILILALITAVVQFLVDCPPLNSVLTVLLSVLGIIGLSVIRPDIEASYVDFLNENKDGLKVTVANNAHRSASNIRVELCLLNEENITTVHMLPDREYFLSLPAHDSKDSKKCSRVFKFKLDEGGPVKVLTDGLKTHLIRVRVYAEDSFSGFGNTTEAIFRYHQDCFEREKTSGCFTRKK